MRISNQMCAKCNTISHEISLFYLFLFLDSVGVFVLTHIYHVKDIFANLYTNIICIKYRIIGLYLIWFIHNIRTLYTCCIHHETLRYFSIYICNRVLVRIMKSMALNRCLKFILFSCATLGYTVNISELTVLFLNFH